MMSRMWPCSRGMGMPSSSKARKTPSRPPSSRGPLAEYPSAPCWMRCFHFAVGFTIASIFRKGMPVHFTSYFVQLVTQWKSLEYCWTPSPFSSAREYFPGFSTSPETSSFQSLRSMSGCTPRSSTGKPETSFCPGGRRASVCSCLPCFRKMSRRCFFPWMTWSASAMVLQEWLDEEEFYEVSIPVTLIEQRKVVRVDAPHGVGIVSERPEELRKLWSGQLVPLMALAQPLDSDGGASFVGKIARLPLGQGLTEQDVEFGRFRRAQAHVIKAEAKVVKFGTARRVVRIVPHVCLRHPVLLIRQHRPFERDVREKVDELGETRRGAALARIPFFHDVRAQVLVEVHASEDTP